MRGQRIQEGRLAVVLLCAIAAGAQVSPKPPKTSTTGHQIKAQLAEFLEAAGRKDKEVFKRFFADDVTYTRSSGEVRGKADIMHSLEEPRPADEAPSTFEGDEVTVREFGRSLAVVNFRLVQHFVGVSGSGRVVANYFRNTGTFLKRDGKWQVIAWQSTRIPLETKASQ